MHWTLAADVITDPTGVISIGQNLSNQSDRTVMFILGALLIVGSFLIIKWLVSRNERQTEKLENIAQQQTVSNQQLSGSLDKMADSVCENTEVLKQIRAKLQLSIAIVAVCLSAGCAKFSGYTEREYSKEGKLTKERVHMRGYTLFDGKAEIAKAKSLQTDKTQSVGVTDTKQESKGDVLPATIKAAGEAAPSFIKPLIP